VGVKWGRGKAKKADAPEEGEGESSTAGKEVAVES
jgi:hypothetical protein